MPQIEMLPRDLAESLKLAVEYCLENGILTEFLSKYKGEVMNSLLQDLTPNEWMEVRYRDGIEQGHDDRDQYFLNLLEQNLSKEEIKKRILEISNKGENDE